MSTVRQLSESKITALLAGGKADVEIETEESTPGFNFKAFFDKNHDVEITFATCLNILKSRKQIFAACKNGKYNFCGHNIIATTANAGIDDWTFKRTEALIRVKMIRMVEKAASNESKLAMYQKVMELPLVSAYGLNAPPEFNACALRLMLCIGGPLSLLSSFKALAPIVFPLAYYQNVKKEKLGIKNFSTYEQVCKVAKVLSAAQFDFQGDFKTLFEEAVKMLSESNPGTASSISLKKYDEQVKYMDKVFNSSLVVDDYGENSKKKSQPSTSNSIEV
uniref:Nucleoprotein n=1 Tax=Mulberry vein banding virus TaxID=1266451 RepID=A0A0C5H8T2_9VIRU|nr:nucleocapsid [Mulberry vein banding virus]